MIKAVCNAIIVKCLAILHENVMLKRKNFKKMKLEFHAKCSMRTRLVMITEGECSNNKLQDINNNNLKNAAELKCNWLQFYANWLHAKENAMVTLKEAVQCRH